MHCRTSCYYHTTILRVINIIIISILVNIIINLVITNMIIITMTIKLVLGARLGKYSALWP